jgi:hypothetical protein
MSGYGNFKTIKKRICIMRICDYISLSISLMIVFLYISYDKPWFLSDIISFFIMGSLIKLFKFPSLKSTSYFLVPIIISNVGMSIYLSYYVKGVIIYIYIYIHNNY